MCNNLSNLIKDLTNSQKIGNKVILFCGAGLSIDSGLPGVKQINKLKKEGKFALNEFNNSPNRKMIFWRVLMSHYSCNINHYYAIALADRNLIDTIITSNYDCLLEQCVSKHFPDWIFMNSDANSSIEKKYTNGKRIIKIHGDIYQKNVDKIHLLTLTKGNKVKGSDIIWNSTFNKNEILWVIGYSGKKEDAAYKNIKKSLDNKLIEKVYWMYLEHEKKPKSKILPEHNDKLYFIPIKGAKEVFKELTDNFLIPEVPRNLFPKKELDPLEKVRESVNVANVTIELLEELKEEIVTDIEKAEENFDDLLEPGAPLNGLSKLFVLRRYNSYTPVLRKKAGSKKNDSKGGGILFYS